MKKILVFLFLVMSVLTVALTSISLEKNGTDFLYYVEWLVELTPEEADHAVIFSNIDGDTLQVKSKNTISTVRFIGIDTPETVHPTKPVEYYGEEASDFTKAILPNDSEILLTTGNEDVDAYGRLLRFVWFPVFYEGREYMALHNLVLIINGYARAYTYFPFREDYMTTFKSAEKTAASDKYGMWKEPERIGSPAFFKQQRAEGILDIAEAKNLPDFSIVEIQGIVVVPPGPFETNLLQIQDETSGITVYAQGVDLSSLAIKTGDLLKVKGQLYTHRKNRELTINTESSIALLGTGTLPEPINIMTEKINDSALQGLLVKTTGKLVEIDDPKYFIDDGSGRGMVYIRPSGINLSKIKLGSEISVTGVLGQYEWEHELWPRWLEDIEAEDFEPPIISKTTLQATNIIDIVLSEPVLEDSVVANKTVRLKGMLIDSLELSKDGRIIRTITNDIIEIGAVFITGVRDLKGNMQNLYKYTIPSIREKRVLFDEAHGEDAGNSDWTIDGGYSDFADSLIKNNYIVESLKEPLSYLTLAQYDVLVLPEPNSPLLPEEIEAMKLYVNEGGSLFLIADHGGADRNGNGWDAVRVFNSFVDYFGFSFDGNDLVRTPVTEIISSPFTHGITGVGLWNGSSITINNQSVGIAIEVFGKPYTVYGESGAGKFVAIGDSSPFDDGTGAPGKMLYNGWFMYDDAKLAINIINWLSK